MFLLIHQRKTDHLPQSLELCCIAASNQLNTVLDSSHVATPFLY